MQMLENKITLQSIFTAFCKWISLVTTDKLSWRVAAPLLTDELIYTFSYSHAQSHALWYLQKIHPTIFLIQKVEFHGLHEFDESLIYTTRGRTFGDCSHRNSSASRWALDERSTSTHALRLQYWKSSKLKSTSLIHTIMGQYFLAIVSSKENVCACNAPRVSRC